MCVCVCVCVFSMPETDFRCMNIDVTFLRQLQMKIFSARSGQVALQPEVFFNKKNKLQLCGLEMREMLKVEEDELCGPLWPSGKALGW